MSVNLTANLTGQILRKSCIHEPFMISGPSQLDRPAVDVGFSGGGVTDKTISRPCPAADRNTKPRRKQETKGSNMIMTLTVFKEVHNTWPAKNGKPAGESYDLLCMDMSNPAEHRMEEMLYYRTKDDERARVWGKSVGTTLQVGVAKIRHGENGGKATLLGSIITEAKKN